MLDSSRSANSSQGTTGVEDANLSGAQSGQQPATATEHKGEEALVSLIQDVASKRDSAGPHVARRRTTTNSSNRASGEVDRNRAPMNWGKLRGAVLTLTVPEKKVGDAPTVVQSIRAIICATYLNILLIFIPLSWAFHFAFPDSNSNKDTLVFVFSFLAIIPLAKLLGFATEELSLRVGQTLAGLLNATLGNAVELIVAIIALAKCEIRIVQASLVGSILSNLLLVLGMCFFAGGIKYSEQGFGASASQLNASLLTISVIAVLLPAAFHFSSGLSKPLETRAILSVSRGTAILLLIIYGAYLLFQLYSHAEMFEDDHSDVFRSTVYTRRRREPAASKTGGAGSSTTTAHAAAKDEESASIATNEVELPILNIYVTIGLLVVVTVLVAITAEWLVDSIQGLVNKGTVGTEFVGVILLPIVGNAAEHVTAVTVSVKDKLNLSLSVAAGSSLQIALFVIPFIVTLGWIMGKPMSLLFDPYESIVLFFTVLIVNYSLQDGKSNWMEGFVLMFLYIIIALTFWFYPGSGTSSDLLSQCS